MREILVLSGKGGAGKTSICSALISLAGSCLACDYDVDASNLPLLFELSQVQEHSYSGGQVAIIDSDSCILCGLCEQMCVYRAIQEGLVSQLACEGCALCRYICPVDAVRMEARSSGRWFRGQRPDGKPMVYAELRPGEENSGKLVAELKDQARQAALQENLSLVLSDGPAGLGCPVISALTAVDLVLMVAEPGVSGMEDLFRLYELVQKRPTRVALLINKHDLHALGSQRLQNWSREKEIPLLGKIPFSLEVADAIGSGQNPLEIDWFRTIMEDVLEGMQKALQSPIAIK
ncbi:MAG TPA: ATP-binding protein [Syntrophomonadaceae bacterium]|nr:ATP-binding protein [Syntrophomonadaceae bacterium]